MASCYPRRCQARRPPDNGRHDRGARATGAVRGFARRGRTSLPSGWVYRTGFIGEGEEQALVEGIGALELHGAVYKSYLARRRVAYFGSSYDFDSNQRLSAAPLAPSAYLLRAEAR